VEGVARAFRLYGRRAPVMIGSYFGAAFRLCWEAGLGRSAEREQAFVQGQSRLDAVARDQELSAELAHALLSVAPAATHARFWPLFRRLYLDAVLAGVAGTGALLRLATGVSPAALLTLVLSSAYLLKEPPRRRYAGRPLRDLALAAGRVARVTGASRVVFGHTHVEEDDGTYLNPGSFTDARGARCYAVLLDETRAQVARL
jgi:hypothetical protein